MTSPQEFDEYWKRRVALRRASRRRYPAPKQPKNRYGYVYLMRDSFGHLKVCYTTRRSDFEVGRMAQHLSKGWTKVKVARFDSREVAQQVEQDVLWLWSRHKVRRRLEASEMPQGGRTEVAEDCDLAVRLFNQTVSATRRGEDAREKLAPAGVKIPDRRPSTRPMSSLIGVLVVGVNFKPTAVKLGGRAPHMRNGWLVREPDNPHDRFAVAVHCDEGQLGYLPARVANSVAEQMGIARPVSVVLSVEPGTPVKITVRSVGTNGGGAGVG